MKLYVAKYRGSEDGFYRPQIYAFTLLKEVYEAFMSQRDSTKFIGSVIKESSKEIHMIMKKLNGKQLLKSTIKTKDDLGHLLKMDIILTSYEEISILSRSDNIVRTWISNMTSVNVESLSDKWLKVLDSVFYYDVLKYRVSTDYADNFFRGIVYKEDINLDIDEFSVFLDLFGFTM